MDRWIPFNIDFGVSPVLVRWIKLKNMQLAEPFFAQTVSRMQSQGHLSEVRVSPLEDLISCGQANETHPAGFIFHISRCGSTLIGNGLRLAESTVVISEAGPISSLFVPLRASGQLTSPDVWLTTQKTVLKALINIFGGLGEHVQQRVVVKFSSWNLLSLSVVRSVWPDVPCLIVIRTPVEVIVSHLNQPAGWMALRRTPLSAHALFGWISNDLIGMSAEEFCARIIGLYCRSARMQLDAHCRVLDYERIDGARIVSIANWFGLNYSKVHEPELNELLRKDAKDPYRVRTFRPDALRKQSLADEHVKRAASRWAVRPYNDIKQLEWS